MTNYKRLTSDVGFARNLPINEELYDRLYELENAIEDGTLVPKYSVVDVGDAYCVCSVDTENLLVIDEYETEAEARAKLNSLNDEFAECRDCPAWSGSDCTRHPYNEGCLKEVNKEKNDNDL